MLSLFALAFIPFISCGDFSFSACNGIKNEYFNINNVVLKPYPLKYPGTLSASYDYEIIKDFPVDNLKFALSVDKLEPTRMRLPCLNGFGSCIYDYCEEKKKSSFILFNQFSFGDCPVKSGKFHLDHPTESLPDFGSIFNKIIEGDFEVNGTFFNGKSNEIYGCLNFKFTFSPK